MTDYSWMTDANAEVPSDSPWLDKLGNPISPARWGELHKDHSHTVIGFARIAFMEISTVWVGIDMGHGRTEKPMIFETMIFGGPLNYQQWRYSTEEDARQGHVMLCALMLDGPLLLTTAREIEDGRARHSWVKFARDLIRHNRRERVLG